MLHRNWRGLRNAGESSGVSVQFVGRILVFGIYIFASILQVTFPFFLAKLNIVCNRFSLATVWDPRSAVPDMYAATSTSNIWASSAEYIFTTIQLDLR